MKLTGTERPIIQNFTSSILIHASLIKEKREREKGGEREREKESLLSSNTLLKTIQLIVLVHLGATG